MSGLTAEKRRLPEERRSAHFPTSDPKTNLMARHHGAMAGLMVRFVAGTIPLDRNCSCFDLLLSAAALALILVPRSAGGGHCHSPTRPMAGFGRNGVEKRRCLGKRMSVWAIV